MSQATTIGRSADSVEQTLRVELARCQAATAAAAPVLRHLLANEDPVVFSDAVVASVRGMIANIADELLEAFQSNSEINHGAKQREQLVEALADNAPVLAHVHAVGLEVRLTERLQLRAGVDEVVSPLLEELSASHDPELVELAGALIAAQTRFMRQCRQMALPLAELPAAVFDAGVEALHLSDAPDFYAAERISRDSHAGRRRVDLLADLVDLIPHPKGLLSIEEVGLATFVSALAKASMLDRDEAVLLLTENQGTRLLLALRAAGVNPRMVEQQFQAIHPDTPVPDGFAALSPQGAAALLQERATR